MSSYMGLVLSPIMKNNDATIMKVMVIVRLSRAVEYCGYKGIDLRYRDCNAPHKSYPHLDSSLINHLSINLSKDVETIK